MKDTVELLIKLVRSEITGEELNFPEGSSFDFDGLIKLAKSHEILQLVSDSIINNGLITEEKQLEILRENIFYSSYRDTKNRYALDTAQKALENAHIEYVPLKGAVIRNFYPETWMRMSCDIDVLVPRRKFNDAVEVLKQSGFKVSSDKRYHDISLILDDVNLELHFSICEDVHGIDFLLKDVWEYTVKDTDYRYFETNDYFVFHHIAHMVYHFLTGGCGIRPLIDLWILKRRNFFDEKEVRRLCEKAEILDFYDAISETIAECFEGEEFSPITERIIKYLADGGVYGTFPNNAAAYTVLNGGKIKFILSMVFPSIENMRVSYPVLNKVPVLLPFCHFHRLFNKAFGKDRKAARKVKVIKGQDKEFIKEVGQLIKDLKLKK